jgi:Mrp family chromosome partitioning ATPase
MSIVEKALEKHRGGYPGAGELERDGPAAHPDAVPLLAQSEFVARQPELLRLDEETVAAGGYKLIGRRSPALTAQFRATRRMVLDGLASARGKGRSPIVVVTSAVAGEGKSFVSLNLAASLATERSLSVTLVDFDAVRPISSQLLGATGKVGVRELLSGATDLQSSAFATQRPGLSFIAAGTTGGADEELFAGPAVDELLVAARAFGPGHMFLFDCPPVLASEDARYIAQRADYAVFVVRAERTSQNWTLEALERLGSGVECGLLLNGRVGSTLEGAYGYQTSLEGYTNAS